MKTSTGGAMDHHDNIIKQSSMYNFQALRFKRYLYSYIPIILGIHFSIIPLLFTFLFLLHHVSPTHTFQYYNII